MTAILGGGLAGLTASYHALQNPKASSIVLIEASNRLGGWIRSRRSPSGAIFEQGPRTVRVSGPNGKNTLRLLDRLKLSDKIIPINHLHPASYNRMIYAKNTMVTLQSNLTTIYKTIPPFSRSFLKALIIEVFKPRVKLDDESVHSFIERRFGREIADYVISPMMAGIFAGDAKQLSIKSFAKNIFEAEQQHGSVLKGLIMKKLQQKKELPKNSSITADVLMTNSVKKAQDERWTMWTLENGLETLPEALGKTIKKLGADVRLNSSCEKLHFLNDGVEITVAGKKEHFSHVISALPAWQLANLLKSQHPKLSQELESIPTVDVGVVNLQFEGKILTKRAFGFLVAPIENRPILGVIFDSGLDPTIEDYTTMTVMMGGAWYDKYLKDRTEEDILSIAVSQVKEILKIDANPNAYHVSILKKCIPQYVVGHQNRLERIRNYISTNKLPLLLCGSSYEGVGINDVVTSAQVAAESIMQNR